MILKEPVREILGLIVSHKQNELGAILSNHAMDWFWQVFWRNFVWSYTLVVFSSCLETPLWQFLRPYSLMLIACSKYSTTHGTQKFVMLSYWNFVTRNLGYPYKTLRLLLSMVHSLIQIERILHSIYWQCWESVTWRSLDLNLRQVRVPVHITHIKSPFCS